MKLKKLIHGVDPLIALKGAFHGRSLRKNLSWLDTKKILIKGESHIHKDLKQLQKYGEDNSYAERRKEEKALES